MRVRIEIVFLEASIFPYEENRKEVARTSHLERRGGSATYHMNKKKEFPQEHASPDVLPSLLSVRAWAAGLDPDQIVGRTCSWNDCPLAHALEALLGGNWDVSEESVQNYSSRQSFGLPTGYAQLIRKIDALDGTRFPGIWLHRQIEAKTLLLLADEVVAEKRTV